MAPLALLLLLLAPAAPAAADEPPPGWQTYRSARFGYALSYPPEMRLRAYFGGSSATLADAASDAPRVELELWPGDLCPRERPGTTARALGLERAATVTQADGPDGSSHCGEPVRVEPFRSRHGVPLYALALACVAERRDGERTIGEAEGTKGPTFFADVSQPWRTRVLMIDPVGVDPRLRREGTRPDAALVRRIAETVAVFPLPDPHVVCIEDLR